MLTTDQLRHCAPSIFATAPYEKMSEKYRFVPTIDVVNELSQNGFLPVKAAQARTRIEGKGDFVRHVIRFRHRELNEAKVGDSIPEIVLLNSHDGSSSYKIMMVMFRLICSNGMVVASGMIDEIAARHSGKQGIVQEVIDGSFRVIENAPKVMKQVQDWQSKTLTDRQQVAYANAALELRDSTLKIDPAEILAPHRGADDGNDVWRTFNRVQENMIRGGMSGMSEVGIRRTTRAVKSCAADVKLNRALWRLTEELAKVA